MTREEKEHIGKYILQMARLLEDGCYQQEILLGAAHIIDEALEQEARCKDCKWWKDSDGAYRRGVRAESRCPINRIEVFDGNGYCFMFEPQERSEKDGI